MGCARVAVRQNKIVRLFGIRVVDVDYALRHFEIVIDRDNLYLLWLVKYCRSLTWSASLSITSTCDRQNCSIVYS